MNDGHAVTISSPGSSVASETMADDRVRAGRRDHVLGRDAVRSASARLR